MTRSERMKFYAPTVLRVGISLVFLWFGTQQLLYTSKWVGLIPQYAMDISGMSSSTLVHFNGTFEIVFGICLLLGFFTRVVVPLLALHMISITMTVGYNAIGVRDFGLSMATIALFLYGEDSVSLDAWLRKRRENYIKN